MSAVEEHLATRRAAGLFDFSFMGLYEFHDKAALQALQTRNLDRLAAGQIAYTLLLKADGAVLIDATVWDLGAGRYWLFAGRRGAYGGRDRSNEYAILALQGPASGRILARLTGIGLVQALRYFRFTQHDDIVVGRLGFSGELGYELLVPAAKAEGLRHRVLDAGWEEKLRDCSWAAADTLRIESGYVLFDREVDGRANPHELGLGRLVEPPQSFPMREKLVGLEILPARTGGDLPPARVTSECFSPSLGQAIGLGFAPAGHGSIVRLADGRGARVVPLPFYDPGRRRPRAVPV